MFLGETEREAGSGKETISAVLDEASERLAIF